MAAAIGAIGGFQLAYQEWLTGTACPDMLPGVPACYFIAFIFALILIASFTLRLRWLLWLASLIGVAFSGYATIQNLIQGGVCPMTSAGIPLCYVAVTLFGSISLSLLVQRKTTTTTVIP